MNIVISAPNFTPTVGGHVVVHKLCDSLLKQNMPVYLKPQNEQKFNVNPNYLSRVITKFDPEKDVAIYHNSIKGNPWKAKKIIRWMLYTPTNETDGVVLYYSKQFGTGPILRIIDPHLDIFYDKKQKRKGNCWTWRKARKDGWKESLKPTSGIEIARGTDNNTLSNLFNRTERFTCYDGASFLSIQAALCGCDSLVLRPVGGKFGWPGIATSEKEIPVAREQHKELRDLITEEYTQQDIKAKEMIEWAIAKLK